MWTLLHKTDVSFRTSKEALIKKTEFKIIESSHKVYVKNLSTEPLGSSGIRNK
jgi:hypothetical protein